VGIVVAGLLLVLGSAKSNETAKRLGLGLLVFVGLITLPVYFTGQSADRIVENLPWVVESIEPHRDAATLSLVVVGALGAIALGALLRFPRGHIPGWFLIVTLAVSIAGGALMAWTVSLDGLKVPHRSLRGEYCESCHQQESEFYRGNVKVTLVGRTWKGPVTCIDCHDFIRKEGVGQKCIECHTTSYLVFLEEWTSGFDEERALIEKKVQRAESALAGGPGVDVVGARVEKLVRESREALERVRRGPGVHHPEAARALLTLARQKADRALDLSVRR
jgi:hypothetical protein